MINLAEEPLTRVTLNLFAADVDWLHENIGPGWTKMVRDLVRDAITAYKEPNDD